MTTLDWILLAWATVTTLAMVVVIAYWMNALRAASVLRERAHQLRLEFAVLKKAALVSCTVMNTVGKPGRIMRKKDARTLIEASATLTHACSLDDDGV
jgi:hypothetical protein